VVPEDRVAYDAEMTPGSIRRECGTISEDLRYLLGRLGALAKSIPTRSQEEVMGRDQPPLPVSVLEHYRATLPSVSKKIREALSIMEDLSKTTQADLLAQWEEKQ
jgi:hypothetical protein